MIPRNVYLSPKAHGTASTTVCWAVLSGEEPRLPTASRARKTTPTEKDARTIEGVPGPRAVERGHYHRRVDPCIPPMLGRSTLGRGGEGVKSTASLERETNVLAKKCPCRNTPPIRKKRLRVSPVSPSLQTVVWKREEPGA